ncbi:hypothetical protein BC834DRAFT_375394 [Gloeopeniophorella convolvens]|nr:hypothetical protein BC834DRAFT_375394 [Gloeopeniophorella convolvens]
MRRCNADARLDQYSQACNRPLLLAPCCAHYATHIAQSRAHRVAALDSDSLEPRSIQQIFNVGSRTGHIDVHRVYSSHLPSGKTSQPQNAPAGFVAGGNAQHAASENSYATSDGANVTNFPADAAYPGTFNTNDPNNARQQDPQDGWIPGFASMVSVCNSETCHVVTSTARRIPMRGAKR